jgi:hypothetical protein
MTADLDDSPGTAAQPVSRTWWVLPYCAGALAVFLVAGIVIWVRHPSGTAQPPFRPR